MRNRWVRRAFLGLVLVFPILISAVSSHSLGRAVRGFRMGSPIMAVEMLLVGGLVFASRERSRLLVEIDAARTTPRRLASRPPVALAGLKAPAKHTVFGSRGR
jgi:hypothetical protein